MIKPRVKFKEEKRKILNFMVRKALIIFAICNTLALVFLYPARKLLQSNILVKEDNSAWEIFFSFFGVIYAIIVGLLIIEALKRFHDLAATIEQEINAVEDIRDFLIYFEGNHEVQKEIKESLIGYINSVTNHEWSNMRDNPEEMDSDTSPELRHVMESVRKIRVSNDLDKIALRSIIDKIAKVTTYRTQRINLSVEHVSGPLRYLIVFMSLVILCGFYLLTVKTDWMHGLMIFSIVTAMVGLLWVILDLNRPFGVGFWDIESKPFEAVVNTLKDSQNLLGSQDSEISTDP